MSVVSDFLDNLFGTVVKDELKVAQPVADSYLNSIIGNSAPDNVVAQSLAFVPAAMAALPNLEATAARDAATALKALLDAQLPALIVASLPVPTDPVAATPAA